MYSICCNTTKRATNRFIRGHSEAGSVRKRVPSGNGADGTEIGVTRSIQRASVAIFFSGFPTCVRRKSWSGCPGTSVGHSLACRTPLKQIHNPTLNAPVRCVSPRCTLPTCHERSKRPAEAVRRLIHSTSNRIPRHQVKDEALEGTRLTRAGELGAI